VHDLLKKYLAKVDNVTNLLYCTHSYDANASLELCKTNQAVE